LKFAVSAVETKHQQQLGFEDTFLAHNSNSVVKCLKHNFLGSIKAEGLSTRIEIRSLLFEFHFKHKVKCPLCLNTTPYGRMETCS